MNNKRNLLSEKFYISIALVLTMSVSLLCGCTELRLNDKDRFNLVNRKEEVIVVPDSARSDEIIVVEKVEELSQDEEVSTAELSGVDFAEAKNSIISEGSRYYAYSTLNEEEQVVYTEILSVLNTLSKDVKVSCLDTETIDKVFNCVLMDHPELFYISGYSYTKFVRGDKLEKITITGSYTMDKKEIKAAQDRINAYTEKCIRGYNEGLNEYKMVKYVYEYLIKNNEYDITARNNQNILSVVDGGHTVCQGYAKMTQYLLNQMGVFCTLCEGVVKGSESHVWNIVKIDNSYYHVDTTWGDASYNLVEDANPGLEIPEVNYDYLCVDDDEIKETHVIKESIVLPVCDSSEANYYVKENLYFTELNIDQVKAAFNNASEHGDKYVTFKCANPNVYAAIYAHLIQDQNIFNYIDGNSNVNYVEFKDECCISFYL